MARIIHLFASLLLVLLLSFLVPEVSAKECSGGSVLGVGCWICGKAVNKTPWTMLYTRTPGGKCGKKCCQILNWDDGDGSFTDAFVSKPKSALVACTQDPLESGGTKGGNTCKESNKLDVDAITFADRDWTIATPGPGGKGGSTTQTRSVTKGVWVKISSLETITCVERNGKPYCVT